MIVIRRLFSLCCLLTFAVALSGRPLMAQSTSDIIRGNVTGPDSLPVQNVVVTATSYSGSVTKTARTDRRGVPHLIKSP